MIADVPRPDHMDNDKIWFCTLKANNDARPDLVCESYTIAWTQLRMIHRVLRRVVDTAA
jgi:hypothetical protein